MYDRMAAGDRISHYQYRSPCIAIPQAHQQNGPIEVPLAQFMPDNHCGKPELKGSPTSYLAFRALNYVLPVTT